MGDTVPPLDAWGAKVRHPPDPDFEDVILACWHESPASNPVLPRPPNGVARHRRARAWPPGQAGARRLRPAAEGRPSFLFQSVRAAGWMQPACPERPPE